MSAPSKPRPHRKRKLTVADARRALEDEPLVTATGAAAMLDVHPANLTRDWGHRLRPVEAASGGRILRLFFASEVQALVNERAAQDGKG